MNTAPKGPPRRPHPALTVVLSLVVTALDALLLAAALGGLAALLAHPRALVLLGLWAVGGITLALLRPVRGQDTVAVEREAPIVLIALLLIPLATPPIAALGERLALWTLPGGAVLRWAGVALSGAGLAIRIAAMAQLGPRFSPRVAMQREHALETRGLYTRIRHPGYAGAWLAALGGAIAFGSAIALPLVAAMGLMLWSRAGREEAMLERHFGDEYRSYRARTGRFVPRLMFRRPQKALLPLLALGVVCAACNDNSITAFDRRPNISSVTVVPSVITLADSATITCYASDPDGDILVYDWFTDSRLRIGDASPGDRTLHNTSTNSMAFYPDVVSPPDTCWVQCFARDGRGMSAYRIVDVIVNP